MSLKIDPFGINNTGFIIGAFGFVGNSSSESSSSESSSATRNLKVGSTTITDVFVGGTQVTHVYIGSTLVWSKT